MNYSLPFLLLIYFFCLIISVNAECNGGASLCNLSYTEVTQLITHDSYAVSPNIAATQDSNIVDQLNDGVRGIKLSAVPSNEDPSIIHLCHTFCSVLDAGSVADTLNNITTWLKQNPKEIVTIMWNNLYNFKATDFATAYEESNIMPMIYTHDDTKPWPTLQEMIDSGKRVVNFIDAEADPEQVPWLMNQFTRVFETPYDNTDINAFNCDVDRIGQDLDPKNLMYVMNHFLYGVIQLGALKIEIPYKEQAEQTNSRSSILEHADKCTSKFLKKPNFIEVDFYTIGDALEVVSFLNNVAVPVSIASKKMHPLSQSKPSVPVSNNRTTKLSPTEHILIDNTPTDSGSPQLQNKLSILLIFAALNLIFHM